MRAADGDALAFAHGHILRVLTARWLQMPVSAGARFVLFPGAISTLGFERETEALQGWNLVSDVVRRTVAAAADPSEPHVGAMTDVMADFGRSPLTPRRLPDLGSGA